MTTNAIRITAKRDGYRRCGVEHSGTVDHSLGAFSEAQIKRLRDDPLLVVQDIRIGDPVPPETDPEIATSREQARAAVAVAEADRDAAAKFKAEAERILADAKGEAEKTLADAKSEAEKILADAKAGAKGAGKASKTSKTQPG